MALEIGTPAPDFEGITTDGSVVSLARYRGRKLVLYFYPRDDTPGCTAQACSLRDHEAEIRAKGAEVLGVSTQDQRSHQRFTKRHNLNFPLLADVDHRVARAYGAMVGGGLASGLMRMMGVARRVTYVIDEDGRIAHIIEHPDCPNHADEVLALL